ncbi:uracil-DNA glycosylase [uncultured Piscinibacter sp.]|uniref:uracil-DNA glycosylase n=1 Tax=uncultured Piscinibacter sp. TaxID=1131835 RepID=UPI002609DDE7|nr:uracil-DNA glycosylase [uncultured Piscinibacter sp.]
MTADDLAAACATLPAPWAAALPAWTPERFAGIVERVRAVSDAREIAPADPFRALRFAAPKDVKVVVFGQDPYPKPGHADGLAFSAGHGKPASLRRIFQVLAEDKPGFRPPPVWKLDGWAHQGALLLNPTLTIEVGRIGSHIDCGWQALTSDIVKILCRLPKPPVFMLWGDKARQFFIDAQPAGTSVSTLVTRHPSNDFQRRFMAEGRHFLQTADRIDWWAPAPVL